MKNLKRYYPAAIVIAIVLFLWLTFFSVRETEFVLVTQFGRPVHTVTEAGLHAKWFFRSANYFDRRLRIYNPRPSEFLTWDKKNLVIECYVAWQIENPETFVQTVGDEVAPEMRLVCVSSVEKHVKAMHEFLAGKGVTPQQAGVHSGFSETAVMLALRPELVDMSKARPGLTDESFYRPENIPRSKIDSFVYGVKSQSPNGILGDPTGADAETGQAIFQRSVDDLVEEIENNL